MPTPAVQTIATGPRPVSSGSEARTVGGPSLLSTAEIGSGSTLGHYRIQEPLGRGGMGIVYRAYHPGLDRVYALKVMHVTPQTPADPIERFLREARAVAKIGKHPNIVQVHDVGQHGSLYYLAMDLIDGQPLDRAIGGKPLPNRTAAEIAHRVARALDVAHAAGIVHRDLKPSNILLDREGRPQVSDFGLARDVSVADKLSAEGQVLGTLQYMSPEQAAGEQGRVGPLSDVYGVGATLYEMLTGRAPFGGENQFQTWSSVMSDEPVAPRRINPNAHPDLETICLKSMEKRPELRYPSARDLAEELDRFLNNEPIRARPVSLSRRAWRKAAKHRAVVLPLGLALAVLCTVAVLSWKDRARQRDQVRADLASGRLLREHAQPREARDTFKRVLVRDPGNAEAAEGLAWADAEVRRIDRQAEEERRRAIAEKTAADEALTKSGLVQNVLARWILLAEPLRKMEGIFFDSSLSPDDRRAAAAPSWTRIKEFMDETPGDATSQSAMLALAGWARRLSVHEEEGLAWMDKARTVDPDLPYGALMKALVSFSSYLLQQPLPPVRITSRGVLLGASPAETPEMKRLREEIDSLLAEAEHARIWGSGIAEDFHRALQAIQALQGGRPEEAEKGLTAALGTAAMQVFRIEVYLARAKVRYSLKRFTDSIDDLQRVAEVRGRMATVHYYLGDVHYAVGATRVAVGEDPRIEFASAIAEFTKAEEGSPDVDIWGHRGNVWVSLADAEGERGIDPRSSIQSGIEDFTHILGQRPTDDYALANRGSAWARLAREQSARGQDPTASLDRAIRDLEAAVRATTDDATNLFNLGMARLAQADALGTRGQDPRDSYDRATAAFERASAADPELVEAIGGAGMALCSRARAEAAHGADPRKGLEDGVAKFTQALSRDPDSLNLLLNRAQALSFLAGAKAASGEDPIPFFERALTDLARLEHINAHYAPAHMLQGSVLSSKAAAEQAAGHDARPTARLSVAAYDAAVRESPERADAYLERGLASSRLAEAEAAAGSDPCPTYGRAIADFGEVLKRTPQSAPAFNSRGIAQMSIGNFRRAAGKDPGECWQKALEDFHRAGTIDPSHWMCRANRGMLLDQLGRTEEAEAEYEAALKACPGQPGVTKLLDTLRKKKGSDKKPPAGER